MIRDIFIGSIGYLLILGTIWAQAEPKYFGNVWRNRQEPAYFGNVFTQLTPENHGKWELVEPQRDQYNWTVLDNMFATADTLGLKIKYHGFVWNLQQPAWLKTLYEDTSIPLAERNAIVKEELRQFMELVFTRYGSKIHSVDVVNEPLSQPAFYRAALGGNGTTGWDWVIEAFRMAREYAHPDTKLLINEFGPLDPGSWKNSGYKRIIQLLKDRNLIDGIGIQAHFLENLPGSAIKTSLDAYGTYGLPIYISEYTVHIGSDAQQLAVVQDQFPVMFGHPSVQGLTYWGLRQGQVWRANSFLVRTDGTERPAFEFMKNFVQEQNNPIPFRIESISIEGTGATITWPVRSGRSYTVQASQTLEPGSWVDLVTGNTSGSHTAPGIMADKIFFRVVEEP